MKICPACQTTYKDETLNFCLNDGTTLIHQATDDAPPTVIMDAPRATDQTNWQNFGTNAPYNPPAPMQSASPNQMYPVAGNAAAGNAAADQTLPIISLVLGILSLLTMCCYGGIPFGIGAVVVGYIGMNNVKNNPSRYTGKGLAVGGMVLGAISFVLAILFIFLGILGNIFN